MIKYILSLPRKNSAPQIAAAQVILSIYLVAKVI